MKVLCSTFGKGLLIQPSMNTTQCCCRFHVINREW